MLRKPAVHIHHYHCFVAHVIRIHRGLSTVLLPCRDLNNLPSTEISRLYTCVDVGSEQDNPLLNYVKMTFLLAEFRPMCILGLSQEEVQ